MTTPQQNEQDDIERTEVTAHAALRLMRLAAEVDEQHGTADDAASIGVDALCLALANLIFDSKKEESARDKAVQQIAARIQTHVFDIQDAMTKPAGAYLQ